MHFIKEPIQGASLPQFGHFLTVSYIDRAGQVSDDRLKALYAYKADEDYKDIKKQEKAAKALKEQQEAEEAKKQEEAKNKQGADKNAKDGAEKKTAEKSDISISVSLGTSKSESSSTSQTTAAQGSSITGGNNVKITATKEDIKVKGSDITGENVTLDAKKNIEITASENKNVSNSDSKSSSASIGASINLGDGSIGGLNVSGSKQTGEIKENSTTYNQSTVTANDNLTMNSGKDTDIKGSKVSGDKVKVDAGENLNLESLQDKETYDEKNSSAGGVMSKLGGSSFASGAAGAGITQLVMNELKNIKDPAVLQWASAIVGAAAAKLVGGDAKTGASVAASETKNNWLSHDEQVSFANRLKKALVEGDIDGARRIIREYSEISKRNSDLNSFNNEATEGLDDDGAGLLEQLQRYASSTGQTLTNNGLNYDLANLAASVNKFALQLPENHGFDTSTTADTVDQINQPPETVDSVMDNGGSWNSEGKAVRADGTVCDNLPNRGNYAYKAYNHQDIMMTERLL